MVRNHLILAEYSNLRVTLSENSFRNYIFCITFSNRARLMLVDPGKIYFQHLSQLIWLLRDSPGVHTPGELLVPRCVFCSRVLKADAAALFAQWDCGLLGAYFCWILFLKGGLYFCTLNKQKMFRHVQTLIPIKLDESPKIVKRFSREQPRVSSPNNNPV